MAALECKQLDIVHRKSTLRINIHYSAPHFSDYETHISAPQIWEENGGPNVAYLACCGEGR